MVACLPVLLANGPVLGFSGPEALLVDVKVIVKGLPMEGTRVIVVSRDTEQQVVDENPSHFRLELGLQKEYLFSFERPGCMSKQLRFNTAVPPDRLSPRGFSFPFQVTLEPVPPGQRMEYAGPVGYIHFDEATGNFGYSTDYRIQRDAVMQERLESVRAKLDVPAAVVRASRSGKNGGPEGMAVSRLQAEDTGPKALHLGERTAPMVSRVAPKVHVLADPDDDFLPGSSERPTEATGALERPRVRDVHPRMEDSGPSGPIASRDPVRIGSEVKVERLHVTTIVTRQDGLMCTEYRRVVSYYGGVTYFRDGRPCSAEVYEQGIRP
ncbi:MAG: hypothetical protein J5I62_13265 [Flavobacteriales bacterium]|nr:hypothetical protein [Flavobacteriales bacterium]MEB2342643.1 hypothetical protein [Flavobacteriia bacterium]